jgi:uncharacterized membrane protein HdeD (DUF308 family)
MEEATMSFQKAFFTFSKIFSILMILVGIMAVINVFVFELEAYVALIGLGLIAWGVYDVAKDIRDARKGSEVKRLAEEREEIERQLAGKE